MGLIADIFDVICIDDSKEVIATTTLQSANIDVSVQENEWRGGRGNALLGVIHSQRDINISLSDAEFRYDWLAKQLGQSIVTGAGVAWTMPKWYPVTGTTPKIITLDETPLSIDDLVIYSGTTKLVKTTDFTLATNVVTIVKAGIATGDRLEVRTFKYNTSSTTETISIDNSVFADGMQIILETIEIDRDEIPLYKVQYQFTEAVPTGNFTIDTSSERNGVAQSFNLKVIKPVNNTVVGKVLRIPIVA